LTFFNCALCTGFWITAVGLWQLQGYAPIESFMFAGLGAVTSELTYRKLSTIEL